MAEHQSDSRDDVEIPADEAHAMGWEKVRLFTGRIEVRESPRVKQVEAVFKPIIDRVEEIRREHRQRRKS